MIDKLRADVVRLRRARNSWRARCHDQAIQVRWLFAIACFTAAVATAAVAGLLIGVTPVATIVEYDRGDIACSDGLPCGYTTGVTEKYLAVGSFSIDDRVGLSSGDHAMVGRWARHHKRDFDRLFFGKSRVNLSPAMRIGIQKAPPGMLSGDAVPGGFSCGHDIHVRGPVGRTYKTILRHELAHGLIYRYFGVHTRWIHEGAAEWFEATNDYNSEVHRALHAGRDVSLPGLFAGHRTDHFGMYRLCASVVDFLADQHGGKQFGEYLRYAGRSGLTQALKGVYGYSPQSLEAAWRRKLCRN